MSFKVSIPPSVKAKMSEAEDSSLDSNDKKMDWRKLKQLEEDRKNGLVEAMKDENKNDINPHIPSYMMNAPWYTGATQPTLSHQRKQEDKKEIYVPLGQHYVRGVQKGTGATKFRKGACENCGAMGHDRKSCLQRIRAVRAKFSNICEPDDRKQHELNFNFDAKRDRWTGYDLNNHKEIILKHHKADELRREMKVKKLEKSLLEGKDVEDEDDENNDDIPIPVQNIESKEKFNPKNLRIREDTAKYLINLDPNSAYYDPKTRSMRADPHEGTGIDPQNVTYHGDNSIRFTGEARDVHEKQRFSLLAQKEGVDISSIADPTRMDQCFKDYKMKKSKQNDELTKIVHNTYGAEENLEDVPIEVLLGQHEEYVEYTRAGVQIKGNIKSVVRSRYEEDVFEKNHTAVWGSYWESGMWGYKCCHSTFRNSHCLGKAALMNKLPNDCQEESMKEGKEVVLHDGQSNSFSNEKEGKKKHKRKHQKHRNSSDASLDSSDDEAPKHKKSRKCKDKKHKNKHRKRSDDSEDDKEKELKKAIEAEKQRQKEVTEKMAKGFKSQPYNITHDSKAPSEVEVEAYERLKMRDNDPMADYFKQKRN